MTYTRPMSFADYRAIDAVNPSSLKVLWNQSPLHYREALTAPDVETPSKKLGTAVHMAILEPERFDSFYQICPEGMKFNVKAGKEWLAEYGHLPFLKYEEHQKCVAMRAAVEQHPKACRYIDADGQVESVLQWIDTETGIECKGRPDLVLDDGTLVDLKSARDAGPRLFGSQAAQLGYHFSMAMYRDALAEMGRTPPRVLFVAVENEPPHDVVVYRVPDDVLAQGREDYRNALAELAVCRNTDRWPGHGQELDLELPRWAMPDGDWTEGASYEVRDG